MPVKKPDLKADLVKLEQQENQLIADIQAQEKEINDVKTALDLIKKPLPVPVVSGVLGVFDSLKTVVDNEKTELDKKAQIRKFKTALKQCESNL
jgi:hypothetical protein